MIERYFTLRVLPVIMGAKWGKAILSPAASLISQRRLHMHVLDRQGGTIFQIHNHGHEYAREVGYRALLNNALCIITEQCY